jgi:hypothetical protein
LKPPVIGDRPTGAPKRRLQRCGGHGHTFRSVTTPCQVLPLCSPKHTTGKTVRLQKSAASKAL